MFKHKTGNLYIWNNGWYKGIKYLLAQVGYGEVTLIGCMENANRVSNPVKVKELSNITDFRN